MSDDKASFRHDSLEDAESIQMILKALAEGLEQGSLTFSNGEESLEMFPAGLLDLKLTASQEDSRNKINLRISWQASEKKSKKKKLKVSSD